MWRIDQIPVRQLRRDHDHPGDKSWYDISTRFGYYLTSIVGEINEEGEWAYDPALQRLYLWPQGDVPDDVEFSYRRYCVQTSDRVAFNVVRG